jgi:lysophospholipase L1-like esterase
MPHVWRPKSTWIIALCLFASSSTFAVAQVGLKTRAPDREAVSVTPVPRTGAWMQRHESMNANVAKGDAQLLMIGDSITHGWEGSGREVWEKYYGKRHAVNLGIGGDQTQHVLWRLEHGNIDGIHPKLAVLMIGTNNAGARNTPAQIAAGVKAIVEKLRANLPTTKVLVLAIFPRGEKPDNPLRKVNEAANEKIAKLADNQNVFYLDIGKKFLKEDGTLPTEIMRDHLHPGAQGYEIWASSMEPTVARLMAEKE